MSERRKHNRVQGGWASSTPSKIKNQNKLVSAKFTTNSDGGGTSITDSGKGPVRPPSATSSAEGWLGKTVDYPNSTKKFVYKATEVVQREKPKERVISKSGVYNISTDPNGLSRLRLFQGFFAEKEANWIYDQLYHDLPWKQKSIIVQGKECLLPRLTAWYGDIPYLYSGLIQEANPNWLPVLVTIKDRLTDLIGYTFNSMLANLYRNGHDSVDWHSDDEPSLRKNPTIASLSFGDTRMFELRKKPPLEEGGDYTYMEHLKVPLTHGSLLIMEGATQEDWQHRIPREYHDRSPRINLTFRTIFPE